MNDGEPIELEPREERDRDWLCELLDAPERAAAVADSGAGELEAGARCEYLAALGLIGESVAPVTPSPALEKRLLTAARETRSRPAPIQPAAAVPIARRRRGWLLPLAAGLAIAALGLSWSQSVRLGKLTSEVARQAEELALAREVADRLARIEADNAEQATALSLLTASGSEFCPLRPPAASPMPEARGALAMSADGSHWYLRVVGLEPRGDRREYRLWFLLDGDPVDAAVLPMAAAGEPVELLNGRAPDGFNAVAITLEPVGSERPSGPRLLFGNERMSLL